MRASIIIVISLWVLLLLPGRETKAKARISIGPGRSNHKIPRPKDARLRSARRNRAAADQNTRRVRWARLPADVERPAFKRRGRSRGVWDWFGRFAV